MIMNRQSVITVIAALLLPMAAAAVTKPKAEPLDLERVKRITTCPDSAAYYPKLLEMFMSNDTLMTHDDYRNFYYGALFQEDFDPYRPTYDEAEHRRLEPLYYKASHTRSELDAMQRYAELALRNNPLDLEQLKNKVYVLEKRQKLNLAKIWKHKLNGLLRAIASSGDGTSTETAWTVVYPRHEYDFLNLSGIAAKAQEFVPPYYERITVQQKSDKDPEAYVFNIRGLLEQYYLKHPSEQ